MSFSEKMTNLATAFRSVSGYKDKLKMSDMESMVSGLSPYNLLSNTSPDYQNVTVTNGQWSVILYDGISLPVGIYTFSIYVDLTNYNSDCSNRIEWPVGKAHATDSSKFNDTDWGTLALNQIKAGNQGLLYASFEATEPLTNVNLGLSGYPYSAGTLKYKEPMLNAGEFPMPYTSTTLNKVGGVNRSFLFAFERRCAA